MAQSYDLSVPEQVLLYLEGTPFASETAVPLSGGFGNYVYRIKLLKPYEGRRTLVLKHAKPYPPGAKEFALDLARQTFEVEVIRRVRAWLPADSKVGVAAIHRFDKEYNAIIMEDGGEHLVNLKRMMQENHPTPALGAQIGAAIGEFLGKLHTWGKGNEDLLHFFDANKQARDITVFISYGKLVSTLTGEDPCPKLLDPPFEVSTQEIQKISDIAQERAHAVMSSRETLLMGDFWTGNVLVDIDSNGELKKVTILDWEMTKPGFASNDVGQFYAEVELLGRFHPACYEAISSLNQSFLQSYAKAYELDSHNAAVHVGAHLIAGTPRNVWDSKEETRRAVRRGIGYMLGSIKLGDD